MAPRVGIEPTTIRLTVGCSTAELPRNILCRPEPRERVSIKFGARGKDPDRCSNSDTQILPKGKRGPLSGPSKALGMVGCLQGKTRVNMMLTGKEAVNSKRERNEACESVDV